MSHYFSFGGSGSYVKLVPDAKGMRGKHFSFYEFVSEVWHGLGGVLVEGHHFYYDAWVPGSKAGEFQIISEPQQLPRFKNFLFHGGLSTLPRVDLLGRRVC